MTIFIYINRLFIRKNTMSKIISVLGASGSVGSQALDVARKCGYSVDFIAVGSNIKAAECAAREFSPLAVAVADEASAAQLKISLSDTNIKVLTGKDAIEEGIGLSESEVVVNSVMGEAGLLPTLAVINSGKRLALANKESLVIAGNIVMNEARAKNVEILPVDSEHSAIFQSLRAGRACEVKKLLLTASGGPFFGKTREQLLKVTATDALAHPTWNMGKRITIDSATLMNKGFEIIEASHLFGIPPEKIDVLVHRESILHSAVEYIDNAVIGEFSVPDMRMCVQYAVDYPQRTEAVCPELDLTKIGALTFKAPDTEAFPLLDLAKRSMNDGGAMGAVINAADEVAVSSFLRGELSFLGISEVVEKTYERLLDGCRARVLEEILEYGRLARTAAEEIIKEIK